MYYMGVPDMAVGPLYYSLYDAACVTMAAEFPDAGKGLKQTNTTPLTPAEVEEMVRLLMEADAQTVWDQDHARTSRTASRSGASGDTIQIGAAELILRTTCRANSPTASTRSTTATWRTTGCARATTPTRRASST